MSDDDKQPAGGDLAAESVEMLKAVVDGDTYGVVAARFGVTRTAVERRIKAVALELTQSVGIDGLNDKGIAFAERLRRHRDSIILALADFVPAKPYGPRAVRIVSTEELAQALAFVKARSHQSWHDQALFYMLFVTGARPLEIARFEVRDYLMPDGRVRRESELRSEAAINGKARPLHFQSTNLDALLDPYLRERLEQGLELGEEGAYRGLDPRSRLFLSPTGQGFVITPYGTGRQRRYLCRAILEAYRKLFRYAELEGVTSLSVRHTVAARLFERGADEDQVGLLLGIAQRSAVRELMPRRRPTISELVDELA
ncbi:site-specific integrase [Methylibium sp.]|uniref:site-specific integrase n=1 Tax=Methylibium sp. TaxID=2067992 RepID=UPI003D121325